MIIPFIKKDLINLFRNPQEILVLILMPIVFIAILGFALSGFMNGEENVIHATVAWVDHGNEQEDMDEFIAMLQSSDIPEEALATIMEIAKEIKPVSTLKDDVFGMEELQEIINIEEVDPSQLEKIKNNDDYSAIIEIPEQFTLNYLAGSILNESTTSSIQLYKNEGNQISSNIVADVLNEYQEQLTTMIVLGKAGLSIESIAANVTGTVETVSDAKPITSIQYYSIGMSVMFIMFVASNISSFAYREKQMHVFNRIILSNTSRWSYFAGIIVSTLVIAILQQGILYGVSATVFKVVWEDIGALVVLNLSLCFAIGGLAALLTSINFRFDSETASNFFGSILVAIFSLLGGSFTPIADISPVINFLGNLTPNGSGMTALLQLLQGAGLPEIMNYIVYLVGIGIVFLLLAVLIFPKRGEAA